MKKKYIKLETVIAEYLRYCRVKPAMHSVIAANLGRSEKSVKFMKGIYVKRYIQKYGLFS